MSVLVAGIVIGVVLGYFIGRTRAEWGRALFDGKKAREGRGSYRSND